MNNFIKVCKLFYIIPRDTHQRLKKIPTHPKEIHRRAAKIRIQLQKDKERARKNKKIQEDLKLIKFELMLRQAQPKRRFWQA